MDTQNEIDTIISNVKNSRTIKAGVDILVKSLGSLITRAEADPSPLGLGEKIVQHADVFSSAVENGVAEALLNASAARVPSTWDTTAQYAFGDLVQHDGVQYVSSFTGVNAGNVPSATSNMWRVGSIVVQNPRAMWVDTTLYQAGDTIQFRGVGYRSLVNNNTGNVPDTATAFWAVA